MDLSFSGAGFMGCYYFGVADCLKKYIPRDRIKRVAGTSAGSLIAAYYLLELPLSDGIKEVTMMLEGVRQRRLGVFDRNHQIVDMLPAMLDRLFPPNAHKLVSGRLHICMTRVKDMKKIIVSEFETRQDLIDALNCSSFIPVWSGNHCATYKGVRHMDGIFTDNLPVFDEHTIRISCFSGGSEIAPFDRTKLEVLKGKFGGMSFYFNLANFSRAKRALFPPTPQFTLDLIDRGFQDTKNFILSNDLIKCESCYKSSLNNLPVLPTITPAASPMISRSNSYRKLSDITSNATQCTDSSTTQLFLSPMGHKPLTTIRSESDLNNNNNNKEKSGQEQQRVLLEISKKLEVELNKISNNNTTMPSIVITTDLNNDVDNQTKDTDSTDSGESSSGIDDGESSPTTSVDSVGGTDNPGTKQKLKSRRKSLSNTFKSLAGGASNKKENPFDLSNNLVMPEKFTMALNSCPPSPCLRRNCQDCLRLRQEARMDHVEDVMKAELDKIFASTTQSRQKRSGRITRSIKWVRQLRMTTTYKLCESPQGL